MGFKHCPRIDLWLEVGYSIYIEGMCRLCVCISCMEILVIG